MKSKFQMYIQSFAILLVLTMLFSLIFALLYYFNAIQTKTFHTLNWIAGIFSYGSAGVWLGLKVEKKALLNAFLMIVMFAIPSLLLAQHNTLGWVECISKLCMYVLCCMLVFSKRKTSN